MRVLSLPIGVHSICAVSLPVHDPPAVWKSFRGNGGNPGIEIAKLPGFSAERPLRLDTNSLTWLEPVAEAKV
jgi:hypothetical protein